MLGYSTVHDQRLQANHCSKLLNHVAALHGQFTGRAENEHARLAVLLTRHGRQGGEGKGQCLTRSRLGNPHDISFATLMTLCENGPGLGLDRGWLGEAISFGALLQQTRRNGSFAAIIIKRCIRVERFRIIQLLGQLLTRFVVGCMLDHNLVILSPGCDGIGRERDLIDFGLLVAWLWSLFLLAFETDCLIVADHKLFVLSERVLDFFDRNTIHLVCNQFGELFEFQAIGLLLEDLLGCLDSRRFEVVGRHGGGGRRRKQ